MIGEDKIQTFNKDGFILLKDYFSKDESCNIINWASELENCPETSGKWMIYFESNGSRSRIENFLDYHTKINELVSNKLTPLLESLIGEKMSIFKDKMNWKMANGKGFKAHQDQPAWSDFPPKRYFSIALFANNTTVENGCLQFVKGKNNEGLYSHDINGNGELDLEIEKQLEWNHITTTPRDLLIFDSYAPHRSYDNTTNDSRRIFYFTYNKASEGLHYYDYLKKKRIEFPPNIERVEGMKYEGKKYNLANPIL